jgi:hypothetical protein
MVASRTLLVGATAVTAHCPSSLEPSIRVELREALLLRSPTVYETQALIAQLEALALEKAKE